KMEFLDTPGLNISERRDNARRLGIMRDAGGLLIVLNGYSGGNLAEELKKFREEMLFADLEIVLGRIERLQDQLKKPRPAKEKERDQLEVDTLMKVAEALEAGKPASDAALRDDEEKAIRSFQLLTLKKQMVFVNLDEAGVKQPLPADLLALSP